MESYFVSLTRGLAAQKEQGSFCRSKDICGFFKSFIPSYRSQFSPFLYKRLSEPLGTYNLLKFGISNLTCIFSFDCPTHKFYLDVIAGSPTRWTDYVFKYHIHALLHKLSGLHLRRSVPFFQWAQFSLEHPCREGIQ